MRRVQCLTFLGALLAASPGWAQDITGRWLNTGSTGTGQYAVTLSFDGQGRVQEDLAIAAAPGYSGSGQTRCLGQYAFDGQSISMQWASCVTCPAGGGCIAGPTTYSPRGGPVMFLAPTIITIAGDRYSRQ